MLLTNSKKISYTPSSAIVRDGVSNFVVEKLEITDIGTPMISIKNSSNGIVRYNKMINPLKSYSGSFSGRNNGILIENCDNITIEFNRFKNQVNCVYVINSTNIRVVDNRASGIYRIMPRGQFVQFNNVSGPNCRIKRNKIYNPYGQQNEDMINVYASVFTAGGELIIEDNLCRGTDNFSSSGGGILLGDGGSGSEPAYQIARNNRLVNVGQYGICIAGGLNNKLQNNLVFGAQIPNANVGLYVAKFASTLVCANNEATNNRVNFKNAAGTQNNFFFSSAGGSACTATVNTNNTSDLSLSEDLCPLSLFTETECERRTYNATVRKIYFVRAVGFVGSMPDDCCGEVYCTGIDDAIQINSALADGDVLLSTGSFTIKTQITGQNSLYGSGALSTTLNIDNGLKDPIVIGGTRTQIGTDNPINAVSAGSTTITTTSDRTGSISVGDTISVCDNTLRHNIRPQYTQGEFNVVTAINATTITTQNPSRLTYNGSIRRLYKYNFAENLTIGGFNLVYGTTQLAGIAIRLQCCKNLQVFDMIIDGNELNKNLAIGLELTECVDVTVRECVASRIQDLSTASPRGYGLYANTSLNVVFENITGNKCKHLVDCDKGANYINSTYCPLSQNITFKDIEAGSQPNELSNARPFSSHGGAYNVVFENCTQTILAGDNDNGNHVGIISRSVKTTIRNNTVTGQTTNSYITDIISVGENIVAGGTGVNGDGRCCEDLTIENNTIYLSRTTGQYTSTSDGNYIKLRTSLDNVNIRDNNFTGLRASFVNVTGNVNQDLVIDSNVVSFATQLGGKNIAIVTPQSGTNVMNNCIFTSNVITGATDITTPYFKGSISNYTENGNTVS